jgi:hypothetical protein
MTMEQLMNRPYARIVILHITIIGGGVPVKMMGPRLPLVVMLVVLKIGIDVGLHVRSHRKVEEVEHA